MASDHLLSNFIVHTHHAKSSQIVVVQFVLAMKLR